MKKVGPPGFLWILKIGTNSNRLAAELLDLAERGAVNVAGHVVVDLKGVLDAERALGLQAALVDHRVVETPLNSELSRINLIK